MFSLIFGIRKKKKQTIDIDYCERRGRWGEGWKKVPSDVKDRDQWLSSLIMARGR